MFCFSHLPSSKDAMKKDGAMAHDDAMKKDDAMAHDAMKKGEMKK